MSKTIDLIHLLPECDVEAHETLFLASSAEPWFRIEGVSVRALAGRFAEIVYRLSFWDAPARPVFRFWQGGQFIDRIGAAPIAGRAVWVGRVPVGTDRISVSPVNRTGPFNFAIERISRRWWPGLVVDGLRSHPRPARSAVLTRLIGWGPESDVNLAWATGSTPFSALPRWRKSHERPADLEMFDRPSFDWGASPPIRLVIVKGGDESARGQTIASLQGQLYVFWQVIVVEAGLSSDDPRIRFATLEEAEALIEADADGTLTAVLRAGETLVPTALAMVAERGRRSVEGSLFYGDTFQRPAGGAGGLSFKPGWSPRLHQVRPFLGRPLFVRDLKAWDRQNRRHFLESGDCPAVVLGNLGPQQIEPLRRVVAEVEPSTSSRANPHLHEAPPNQTVSASIIIPTRDHPALLKRIVDSIRARSRRHSFRIIVVDNGSTQTETLALLDQLRSAEDARVIDHSGPFNFSLICNQAAALAETDVLVFLNDDMEVLTDGWLDTLIARALDPTIGAVGARLTYPDGRLQHIGVLVGMGESAGHFGALAAGDDPGWLGRNEVLHEVSAVTGACLAVAREKFEAVGGFDAEDLPIELSDIDLCLKLNARGWQTVVDPSVHLLHEESASRGGATFRRLDVHDRERAIFVARWRHVIRDDPFFHPGLSLYRWQPALG